VLYNLDFTKESVQDFAAGGDGDYTLGGVTWAISGTANASTCEVVDSTALRVTTSGTGAINFQVDIADIDATIDYNDQLLFVLYKDNSALTGNEQFTRMRYSDAAANYYVYISNHYKSGAEKVETLQRDAATYTQTDNQAESEVLAIYKSGAFMRTLTKATWAGVPNLSDLTEHVNVNPQKTTTESEQYNAATDTFAFYVRKLSGSDFTQDIYRFLVLRFE